VSARVAVPCSVYLIPPILLLNNTEGKTAFLVYLTPLILLNNIADK